MASNPPGPGGRSSGAFQPWAQINCSNLIASGREAQAQRLADYERIISLIDDENHEVWDDNGKLIPDFLARFSDEDRTTLLDAFHAWENAPHLFDPPGEGANIWPWWADRHPEHTEVEWNIYFDYHIRQSLLPTQATRAFKELTLLDKLGKAPKFVVNNKPNISNITETEPVTRPLKRKPDEELPRAKRQDLKLAQSRRNRRTDQRTVPTPLTLRAHKYGESLDSIFQSAYKSQLTPRKSGLTPTHRPLGASPLTPRSTWREGRVERYQLQNLRYHTLKQLHDLEIIEHPTLPSNLSNTIMPLIRQENWIPSTVQSRPDGRMYDVNQDSELWGALLPSLRLFSRLLTDAHITDWWDDIFAATDLSGGTEIEENIVNNFHWGGWLRRIPSQGDEPAHENYAHWGSFESQLKWQIDQPEYETCYGVTRPIPPYNVRKAVITLSCSLVEPLLRTGMQKLTETEKLVQQYFIAYTLLHEMAHAFWYLRSPDPISQMMFDANLNKEIDWLVGEPFYHTEEVRELGHSMENSVWGGTIVPIVAFTREWHLKSAKERKEGQSLPLLGLTSEEWPNFASYKRSPKPWLNERQWEPPLTPSYKIHAIPLYFIEAVQQQDFWDLHVQKVGGDLLKIHRWVLQWVIRYKKFDPSQNRWVNTVRHVRGKKYSERLAESLGLDEQQTMGVKDKFLYNPELSDEISRRFLTDIDRRMRAVALKVHLREREDKMKAKIQERNMTPQLMAELQDHIESETRKEEAYREARQAQFAWEAAAEMLSRKNAVP